MQKYRNCLALDACIGICPFNLRDLGSISSSLKLIKDSNWATLIFPCQKRQPKEKPILAQNNPKTPKDGVPIAVKQPDP